MNVAHYVDALWIQEKQQTGKVLICIIENWRHHTRTHAQQRNRNSERYKEISVKIRLELIYYSNDYFLQLNKFKWLIWKFIWGPWVFAPTVERGQNLKRIKSNQILNEIAHDPLLWWLRIWQFDSYLMFVG